MMLMTVYLKSTPNIRDKAVFIAVWIEERQKIIKEEGSKEEDRQEVEVKQC